MAERDPKLQRLVLDALAAARANGYTFATAREWAEDMNRYDAELENFEVDVIEKEVERQLKGE